MGRLWALAVVPAVALAGCSCSGKGGGARWTVDVACPCLLSVPLKAVVPRFREAHPRIAVRLDVKGQEAIVGGLLRGTEKPDVAPVSYTHLTLPTTERV